MEQQSEALAGCAVAWSAGFLVVSGEIDVANATLVGDRIRALLNAGNVVVDCRTVTFLEPCGRAPPTTSARRS